MKRTVILTFQYYRILLVYNVAFTIVWIAFASYGFGELNPAILFWAKISGFISAAVLQGYSAKESYFYFRNAGYRMRCILLQAFSADVISFIFAYLLISLIIYAIAHLKS